MGRLGVGAGRFDGEDGYGPVEIEECEILDACSSPAQFGSARIWMASDAVGQGCGERRVVAGQIQKDLTGSYIDAESAHSSLVVAGRFAAAHAEGRAV